MSSIREKTTKFIEAFAVQNTIIILIVLNAITMGLETFHWYQTLIAPWLRSCIDQTFVWIFALEVAIKLYVYRFSFFKNGWNNFDFIIVAISLIPGNGVFSCFRVLRIFRTVRLFGRIKDLRRIVSAMLCSLPNLGWLFLILLIFYYIFAVLSTNLFGKTSPENFGSLGDSFYNLFSLMTMEGWQDTVNAVNSPYARWVFIPFMLLTSYIFLNLVVGIIVAAMEEIVKKEESEQEDKNTAVVTQELKQLSAEIKEIKQMLEKQK